MIPTHAFARRGLEAAHSFAMGDPDDGNPEDVRIPPFAALIFVLTCAAFFALLFAISYTYGHVITTLCMVETPETNSYVPVDSLEPTNPPAYTEDDDDAMPKPTEPEVNLVRSKPITSSLRHTILHLRARAGYWSRFRGLSLFIIWNMGRSFLIGILGAVWPNRLGLVVATVLAEITLARVHMTWIHIVISEPSEKKWYQRVPPLKTWLKITPAVTIWAVTTQIVTIFPMLVCGSFGSLNRLNDPAFEPGRRDMYATAGQLFMAMLLTLSLFVLLQVPATVTMVRVAASMLPEEDETIVPFDRTYGGKTTPAIIGGQGKIGLVEAWRSFPWQSRIRLLKTVAKVAAIVVAVWVAFTIVVVVEAHVMFGEKFGEMMKAVNGASGRH